jgi:hypothetical protein
MSSILDQLGGSILKHVNIIGLAEQEGAKLGGELMAREVKFDSAEERTTAAKRLRDAAACLDAGKDAQCWTDVLQVVIAAVD